MSVDNFLLMLFVSAVIGGVVGYLSCLFIQGRKEVESPESSEVSVGSGVSHLRPELVKELPLSPYYKLLGEIKAALELDWISGSFTEEHLRVLLHTLEEMDPERAMIHQALLEPFVGHYVRFIARQPLWTTNRAISHFISQALSNLDVIYGGGGSIHSVLTYFKENDRIELYLAPGFTFGDALLTVFTRDELELIEWGKENGTLNIDHRDRIISGPTHQPCTTCQD